MVLAPPISEPADAAGTYTPLTRFRYQSSFRNPYLPRKTFRTRTMLAGSPDRYLFLAALLPSKRTGGLYPLFFSPSFPPLPFSPSSSACQRLIVPSPTDARIGFEAHSCSFIKEDVLSFRRWNGSGCWGWRKEGGRIADAGEGDFSAGRAGGKKDEEGEDDWATMFIL